MKLSPFSFMERDEVLDIFKKFAKQYLNNGASPVVGDKIYDKKKKKYNWRVTQTYKRFV